MRKYIIIIGLIATITSQAQIREACFNVNIGGGLNGLKYTLQDGDVKSAPGGSFNIGYSYFFNSGWGIGAGLGLQSAQSKGTLNFTSYTNAYDSDGDNFELRTRYNNWAEKQKALFVDIPIGLQYQHWFDAKSGLLAMAGAKISLPVSSSYEVVSGSIITTGYYEQWNVELSDMPQHGFTTTSARPSGDLTINPSYSVFVDLGWLYKVSEKLDLYAGGYINYGLNSLINASDNALYSEDGTYNSMLASNQADNVKLLTFGIKVGLRLHQKRRSKVAATPVFPVEVLVQAEKEELVLQTVVKPKVEDLPTSQVSESADVKVEEVAVLEPTAEVKQEPVDSLKVSIADAQVFADRIKLRFPLNSASPLNDEFDTVFMELVQKLKAHPEMKVRVQGHTCNLASREFNLKVSKNRAELGKDKLIKFGVPASQISIECKAFDEPVVPNTTEKNRAQNRRICLIIE